MMAATQAVTVVDASFQEVQEHAKPTWYRSSFYGYLLIFMFFGVFGVWAGFVPLGSAVIAMGELRVDSERKTVQHHQGGIVKEILVQEGERVREGQVLVRLDPLRVTAETEILLNQHRTNLAQEARLIAELNGEKEIDFPPELLREQSDPQVAQMLRTQRALFDSRTTTVRGQIDILHERIGQTYTDIRASEQRRGTITEQLRLITEELDGVTFLFEKGLVSKTRLLALQRAEVSLIGDLKAEDSTLRKLLQRVAEFELQIADVRQQSVNTTIAELRNIQVSIPDVEDRLRISRNNMERLDVVAPRGGRVVDRKVHTIGGVISPGQTIMDLVPEDEELIVIARVQPRDIDSAKEGAPVQVRLTSFSQRYTHPIDGVLIGVSNDTTEASMRPDSSGRPQMPYYKARIKLDVASKNRILPDVDLYSGMPAQALISVGERTLLDYWLTPLVLSFKVAMREH